MTKVDEEGAVIHLVLVPRDEGSLLLDQRVDLLLLGDEEELLDSVRVKIVGSLKRKN